ncbi:MAG: rRNA maturation RNase YbeY [Sulfurimonas sp. RIFOXYD12_FULL_33_39]|uniref:rRNA maturation RNase YbeY n=1 Tax=unclassified Sulfurimonas TaxID=2623549 RepID=UPI0008D75EA5|nr:MULTISPECIES: rRNA maturation RNase YbeY [unclassified Sulfurimonas]OHE01593.1 MAG: rRNA maturation RNase YbeY [Sulfurimonas sp. RIFCSPLOWO2_12_FULL_34_6]OHE09547.1 MAG: rRNA maturation RNase YbeY [Sulfurimonas sp. RIFOXYD12_FULL_33_39]OHE13037.1 MAG: rRNA maturation RNase YbeY [Sulfurimonas sp. RIFOXYD2_FULL_34_21]
MIEFDNRTSLNINIETVDIIANFLTKKDIELILTDNSEIKEINKIHRNIDKDTDVLSFPYEDVPMCPLGSIVISASHVQEKAKELEHSEDNEFALLFLHGLLHLLGYDHEIDDGEMRNKEAELIKKFNLPTSLIVRTQG